MNIPKAYARALRPAGMAGEELKTILMDCITFGLVIERAEGRAVRALRADFRDIPRRLRRLARAIGPAAGRALVSRGRPHRSATDQPRHRRNPMTANQPLPSLEETLKTPLWTYAHVATYLQLPSWRAAYMACRRYEIRVVKFGKRRLTRRAWVDSAIQKMRTAYHPGTKGRPPKALQPLPAEAAA